LVSYQGLYHKYHTKPDDGPFHWHLLKRLSDASG
jgi:hypothetical protein